MMHHVTWFLSAVENFRFIDPKVYPFADPQSAVAQVRAEGIIKTTGRIYRQEYVVFLRSGNGKIAFIREYFDPNGLVQGARYAYSRSRTLVTSSDFRKINRSSGFKEYFFSKFRYMNLSYLRQGEEL